MKNKIIIILLGVVGSVFSQSTPEQAWLKKVIQRAEEQLLYADSLYHTTGKLPRAFENEKAVLVSYNDWTSGFFPGSLWYLYEITQHQHIKELAQYYTSKVEDAQYRKNTHDLGFILYCSVGNAYRLTGSEAYKKVLITGVHSLYTRFHANVGFIKSWDFYQENWQYPVIIDNMLNLELLCEVGKMEKNNALIKAAVSHANKTMINHFRPDNSCFHVVNYDSITGKVLSKETHQGYNHASSWARGQGWALYGFTMMFRETGNPAYLKQARKVAAYLLNHPRMTDDLIPYWDFDAPGIPDEPRDASAAAVYASALIELSTYVKDNTTYLKAAEKILKSLSSDCYLAAKGEYGGFILKHSTGNWPKKSEIDVPISYADYYYLEALSRYLKIINK